MDKSKFIIDEDGEVLDSPGVRGTRRFTNFQGKTFQHTDIASGCIEIVEIKQAHGADRQREIIKKGE